MNKNLIGGLFDGRGKPQPLRPSAKAKRTITPEKHIQSDFFSWIFTHEREFHVLRWLHHVPNGGFRHKSVAVQMKREGVRAGVSDCFLPVARKGFNGFYLEFKTETGKLSDYQKEFLEFAGREGYKIAVCRSTKEAAEILIDYLDLPLSAKYLK